MPTVQSCTQEPFEARRFAGAVGVTCETALTRIRAHLRTWLTAVVIVLLFAAIVFVLWHEA